MRRPDSVNETCVEPERLALTTAPRGATRAPGSASSAIAATSAGGRPAARRAASVDGCRSPARRSTPRRRRRRRRRRGGAAIATTARRSSAAGRYRVRRPRPCPRASIDLGERHGLLHPGLEHGDGERGQRPPRATCDAAERCASRTRCGRSRSSAARSTARARRRAPARGTGAGPAARPPNGSVTALNVPNTTSRAASRAPSSAANATLLGVHRARRTRGRCAAPSRPDRPIGEDAERRAPPGRGTRRAA